MPDVTGEHPARRMAVTDAVGRCGDRLTTITGPHEVCALPHGHPGWHRSDNGAEWSRHSDPSAAPPAIVHAAEMWRERRVTDLVGMQSLDDAEQALLDALADVRCGRCRRCSECERDAPFADQVGGGCATA